jgi:hypothetical protein
MSQNVYSLAVNGVSAGQFVQNILHFQFDDAGYSTSQIAAAQLITAWHNARGLTWRQLLPSDYTLKSYSAVKVTGGGGFSSFLPAPGTTAGQRSGTQSATAINPVIVTTPIPFGRGRGKIFLPGVSETDIQDGVYTDAYVTAVTGGLITLLDDLTLAGGGTPTAVYGWLKANGTTFARADKVWLSMNVGTQRRRMKPAV